METGHQFVAARISPGPTLFIIFVNTNEKDSKVDDSKVLNFAVDVKVLSRVESRQDQDAFQPDLDKVFKWLENLQMKFNFKKV